MRNVSCESPMGSAARMGRRELGVAGGLLLLALAVRLVYLEHGEDHPFFAAPVVDAHSYVAQARQLAEVSWVGDKPFWQPPLYPYFLAIVYAVCGDLYWTPRFIQFLLGAASCALVFGIGRLVFGTRVGLLAGVMACLYGPSIYFEGELLPTALAVFLNLLLLFVLLQPGRGWGQALAAGLVEGLAIVAVPNAALLAPCAGLWYWKSTERAGRSKLVWCLLFAAATCSVVGVVTARNWAVSGEFIPVSWNGGVNFYLGNHPDYDRLVGIRPGPEWEALMEQPLAAGHGGYAERSAYFYRQAGDWIANAPGDFVRLLGYKAFLLMRGEEIKRNQDAYFARTYSWLLGVLLWKTHHFAFPFGLLGPLAAVGMVLAWRHRPAAGLLLLCTGAYSASLLLFFITGRYRLPLVPLLLLFAGYALVWLVDQGRERQWRPLGIGVACVALLGLAANAGLRPANPLADAEIHFALGRVEAQRGQYAAAVRSFGTAVQLDPNYLRAHHNLGAALAALRHYDEAEAVYRRALAQAPDDRGLHLNLAALYRTMGRYEQAAEHYGRVLAKGDDAAVFLSLGQVYKKMGAIEQAREVFAAALSRDEVRAQAANELGLIEVRQGALERAVDYFAMALKAAPGNHLIAFNLGAAYHDLGQFDKAAEFYRLTLSLAPEYAKAQRALTRLQGR